MLSNPGNLSTIAKNCLHLHGLERFFTNVTFLNIGKHGFTNSALPFGHFLNNGISSGISSGSKTIDILVGKFNEYNSLSDYQYTNSPFTAGFAKAIAVTKNIGSRIKSSVSLSSFSESMAGIYDQQNQGVLRKMIVTTISDRLSIGEHGTMSLELSRSISIYHANQNAPDSNSVSLFQKLFTTNNLSGNTSISFQYSDELDREGLRYTLHFNKTANGITIQVILI